MHVRVHRAFLPHLDPTASLVLYRDTLGLDVQEDVGSGAMRWLTFGPGVGGGPALVLGPPVSSPGVTDEEHRMVRTLMAKGVYAGVALVTTDLAVAFERLAACGVVEVLQEPAPRPFGGLDFSFLDPSGNVVRVVEER